MNFWTCLLIKSVKIVAKNSGIFAESCSQCFLNRNPKNKTTLYLDCLCHRGAWKGWRRSTVDLGTYLSLRVVARLVFFANTRPAWLFGWSKAFVANATRSSQNAAGFIENRDGILSCFGRLGWQVAC